MAAHPTATPALPDVQGAMPATQVSLSRVGVTGVEKVIRVKTDGVENRAQSIHYRTVDGSRAAVQAAWTIS